MCTGDTCDIPYNIPFKVTRSDTGASKIVWASCPAGAIKIANWPPSICEATPTLSPEMWVEADEAE